MRSFKRDVAVERISDEHAGCSAGVSADCCGVRRCQLFESRTGVDVVGDDRNRMLLSHRPAELNQERGFSRADIALQEPLHWVGNAKVGHNLVDGPLLGARHAKRQSRHRSTDPRSVGS